MYGICGGIKPVQLVPSEKVGEMKGMIKEKSSLEITAKKIKLWKVEISDDLDLMSSIRSSQLARGIS